MLLAPVFRILYSLADQAFDFETSKSRAGWALNGYSRACRSCADCKHRKSLACQALAVAFKSNALHYSDGSTMVYHFFLPAQQQHDQETFKSKPSLTMHAHTYSERGRVIGRRPLATLTTNKSFRRDAENTVTSYRSTTLASSTRRTNKRMVDASTETDPQWLIMGRKTLQINSYHEDSRGLPSTLTPSDSISSEHEAISTDNTKKKRSCPILTVDSEASAETSAKKPAPSLHSSLSSGINLVLAAREESPTTTIFDPSVLMMCSHSFDACNQSEIPSSPSENNNDGRSQDHRRPYQYPAGTIDSRMSLLLSAVDIHIKQNSLSFPNKQAYNCLIDSTPSVASQAEMSAELPSTSNHPATASRTYWLLPKTPQPSDLESGLNDHAEGVITVKMKLIQETLNKHKMNPFPSKTARRERRTPAPPKDTSAKDISYLSHYQSSLGIARYLMRVGENNIVYRRFVLFLTIAKMSSAGAPRGNARNEMPPAGEVPLSFLWTAYPPVEHFLRRNMKDYYEISLSDKCRSIAQIHYNKALTAAIREVFSNYSWSVSAFTDKDLRSRIRCYYKVSASCLNE